MTFCHRNHHVICTTRICIINSNLSYCSNLQLSGIGPRETLDKFNIPIVYENEHVGQHLLERKASLGLTVVGLKDIVGDDTALLDVLAISEKTWSYFVNKNTYGKF